MKATLELTQEQLSVVSEALAELPFKKAAPVISAIQLQLRAAQVKADTAKEVKVEEEPAAKPK